MNKLRIGFLSTAGIGKKNWKAVANSGNCVVAAVASRDMEKSRQFIRECQAETPFETVPEAMGSYEAMLAAPHIDAVYIPLPTGLRKKYVLRAAAARKHIICEKPCANNAIDLQEMISECEKYRVQFMDGVMFMHSPRMAEIRKVLNDGKSIGSIRRISSAFTFYPGEEFFNTNIRANGSLEPTGCLGDLGWYCIRFALWVLNWQMPVEVGGRVLSKSANLPGRPPAPTEFSAELYYNGGLSVEFYCAFRTAKQQWVHVSGQNGWLLLPDFIHPYDSYEPAINVNEQTIRVEGIPCPPGNDQAEFGHATAQDTLMFRNFANQIFSGHLNQEWPMWSLRTQMILDACYQAASCR